MNVEIATRDGGLIQLTMLSMAEEEPGAARTALLTVRAKDNDLDLQGLEKLAAACQEAARMIREER